MPYAILARESASKNISGRKTVIESGFSSEREARDKWKREDYGGIGASEVHFYSTSKELHSYAAGYAKEHPALGFNPDAARILKRRAELAEQATEKGLAGEQLSSAERLALKQTKKIQYTDPFSGQRITGTGRSALARVEMARERTEEQAQEQAEPLEPSVTQTPGRRETPAGFEVDVPEPVAEDIVRAARELPEEFRTQESMGELARASIVERERKKEVQPAGLKVFTAKPYGDEFTAMFGSPLEDTKAPSQFTPGGLITGAQPDNGLSVQEDQDLLKQVKQDTGQRVSMLDLGFVTRLEGEPETTSLFRERGRPTGQLESMELFGSPVKSFGASVVLGLPKAAKAVPVAVGFGALTFISPVAAGVVALAASPFFIIKDIQEQIARKGVTRTVGGELPSFALFSAAGKGGVGARRLITSRKKVKIKLGTEMELASKRSKDVTTIGIPETTFIAQTGRGFLRKTFIGTGLGKARITPTSKQGWSTFESVFKFEVKSVVKPKVSRTIFASRGRIKKTDVGAIGIGAGLAKTTVGRKSTVTPSISIQRTTEVKGGQFPQLIIRTGDIIPGGPSGLRPSVGRAGVLSKVGERIERGKEPVEFYKLTELGKSAKELKTGLGVRKTAPKIFKTKRAELILQPPKTKGPLSKLKPEGLVAEQFLSGARQAVRGRVLPKAGILPLTRPSVRRDISFKFKPVTETKPIQPIGVGLKPTLKLNLRPVSETIPVQDVIPIQTIKPALVVKPFQAIRQAQVVKPRPVSDVIPSPAPPPVPTRLTPFISGGTFPSPKPPKTKRKKLKGFDFAPEYVASVTASYLNIFGKKPKRITGIELRPLLKIRG